MAWQKIHYLLSWDFFLLCPRVIEIEQGSPRNLSKYALMSVLGKAAMHTQTGLYHQWKITQLTYQENTSLKAPSKVAADSQGVYSCGCEWRKPCVRAVLVLTLAATSEWAMVMSEHFYDNLFLGNSDALYSPISQANAMICHHEIVPHGQLRFPRFLSALSSSLVLRSSSGFHVAVPLLFLKHLKIHGCFFPAFSIWRAGIIRCLSKLV